MSFKLSAARLLARAVGLWRRHRPLRGWRILMYHAVGTAVPGDVQGRYCIGPRLFAAHMRALAAGPRRVVSLLDDTSSAADIVSLTFDDGFRDNFEIAYPLLQQLSLPFTIFVTADHVRSGNPRYLTIEQLRQMAADPLVTIGAHGTSHRRLAALHDEELRAELRDSKAFLEDELGCGIYAMSYPHGSVNARVRAGAAEAGFRVAAGSVFGINAAGTDPLCLRRTDIWSSDSTDDFSAKLAGAWDWMGALHNAD